MSTKYEWINIRVKSLLESGFQNSYLTSNIKHLQVWGELHVANNIILENYERLKKSKEVESYGLAERDANKILLANNFKFTQALWRFWDYFKPLFIKSVP